MQHEISLLTQDLRKYLQENYSPEERVYYSPENVSFLRAQTTHPIAPIHSVQTVVKETQPLPKQQPQPASAVTVKRKPLPFTQPEVAASTPSKEEKREIRLTDPKERQNAAPTNNHTEILQSIRAHFPDFRTIAPPKPDAAPLIAILKQGESGAELRFLHHIAEAIQSCFQLPCKVIARTNAAFDPTVTKLMIAAEHRLPAQLPDIPLLALPDLSLHMQNPSLKANLWSTICQNIRKYVHR